MIETREANQPSSQHTLGDKGWPPAGIGRAAARCAHLHSVRSAAAPRSTTSSVLPGATSAVLCWLESARSDWPTTS